jgi:hypothetical protein
MGKSCPESILLILRELLPYSKQALKLVPYGITRVFAMVKENGNIKWGNYKMMLNLNRSFVWRQIGSSLKTNNQKGQFVYE